MRNSILLVTIVVASLAVLIGCGAEDSSSPMSDSTVHTQLDWTPPVPSGQGDKKVTCNLSGPVLNTFTIDGDTVKVISCYFDNVSESLKLFVSWPDEQLCRNIEIYRDTYSGSYNGFVATSSVGTNLKFGMSFSWVLDQYYGTTSEWTGTDYLDIELTPDGAGYAAEEYNANGVVDSFGYDISNPTATYDKASSFASFYADNVEGTTLDDNPEGHRLGKLITHQAFLNWLYGYFGYTQVEVDGWDWKRGVIHIGGTLKCIAGGGVANPACHVYIGATLAFGLADIVCDLTEDCD